MPRGKNYVNNNRGMTVQSSSKKKAPSMEQCFYGKGCTRPNCFYRHDGPGTDGAGNGEKSTEPCMSYLAGLCTFSAGGCRKRHPNKAEAERLIAKYKQTKCRYGKLCKTAGCLYIHEGRTDDNGGTIIGGEPATAFPPLVTPNTNGHSNSNGIIPQARTVAPTGAWKPMQPTGAAIVAAAAAGAPRPMTAVTRTTITPQQEQQQQSTVPAAVKSAWQVSPPPSLQQPPQQQQPPTVPAPAPAPPVSAWGQPGRNPILANHSGLSANPTAASAFTAVASSMPNGMIGHTNTITSPPTPTPTPTTKKPMSMSFAAAVAPPQSPRTSSLDAPSLNIHAKEFVPGGNY